MDHLYNDVPDDNLEYEACFDASPHSSSSIPTVALLSPESPMMNIFDQHGMLLSRNPADKTSTVTSSTAGYPQPISPCYTRVETTSLVRYLPPYTEDFDSTETRENEWFIRSSNDMAEHPEYSQPSRGFYSPLSSRMMPVSNRIHVNPSILLSQHRANYQGIGTPLPILPSNNYATSPTFPHWPTVEKVPEKPKERKKRKYIPMISKNRTKNAKRARRRHRPRTPTKLARIILQVQANKHAKTCESEIEERAGSYEEFSNELAKQQSTVIERQRKLVDARVWLQAKAQLVAEAQAKAQSTTNKTNIPAKLQTSPTKRFVDRATSPIDFKDEQIKPKTHDVALSPIRFIESSFKRRLQLNENSIDLSAKLPTTPLKCTGFHTTLKHKCLNCNYLHSEDKRGCPTCHAVILNSSQERDN